MIYSCSWFARLWHTDAGVSTLATFLAAICGIDLDSYQKALFFRFAALDLPSGFFVS